MSNEAFYLVFNPSLGMVARGLDVHQITTNIEDAAQANYTGAMALVRVLGEGEWAIARVYQADAQFHWVGFISQGDHGLDQLKQCLGSWGIAQWNKIKNGEVAQ